MAKKLFIIPADMVVNAEVEVWAESPEEAHQIIKDDGEYEIVDLDGAPKKLRVFFKGMRMDGDEEVINIKELKIPEKEILHFEIDNE